MIKMYVMQTCPDCEFVEKQVEGESEFRGDRHRQACQEPEAVSEATRHQSRF